MSPASARPVCRAGASGFTLVELLVVLLLIALVSGMASLALRDGGDFRLEREAMRLAALLESGRAEARASGVAVRFELTGDDPGSTASAAGLAYRFVGLPASVLPSDLFCSLPLLHCLQTSVGVSEFWLRLATPPPLQYCSLQSVGEACGGD